MMVESSIFDEYLAIRLLISKMEIEFINNSFLKLRSTALSFDRAVTAVELDERKMTGMVIMAMKKINRLREISSRRLKLMFMLNGRWLN